MADKDYYAELGVSSESEEVVIRAAYRAMMLKYHPDTNNSAEARARAQRINEAYAVLSDPVQRREYDAQFARSSGTRSSGNGADRKTSPPPPPPPPSTSKGRESTQNPINVELNDLTKKIRKRLYQGSLAFILTVIMLNMIMVFDYYAIALFVTPIFSIFLIFGIFRPWKFWKEKLLLIIFLPISHLAAVVCAGLEGRVLGGDIESIYGMLGGAVGAGLTSLFVMITVRKVMSRATFTHLVVMTISLTLAGGFLVYLTNIVDAYNSDPMPGLCLWGCPPTDHEIKLAVFFAVLNSIIVYLPWQIILSWFLGRTLARSYYYGGKNGK